MRWASVESEEAIRMSCVRKQLENARKNATYPEVLAARRTKGDFYLGDKKTFWGVCEESIT